MDSSNPRKSDAAATRKRRSSILKSQRSVRAPLSELEFNVATPPDQAKSRRVSFSRRTGVAEFEISEATTAWKNVYEEHNKSLESSANESGMKAGRRRVSHLGGRASHFTDDEADAIDALMPPTRAELSELAAQNTVQLFRVDADPALRERTDDLRVDFSAVAPLSDDLDAPPHDYDRETCNISEYSIDVDFNSTHISLKADDDDMSITDTIRSPTVAASETKPQVDWTADKENIVVNPYVAPKASDNFAVIDDCEDVLVFDGKKCKFQSNLDLGDDEMLSRTVVYDTVAGDMSVTHAVARVVLPARDEVNIAQPGRVGERTEPFDDDMTVTGIVPAQILSRDLSDGTKSRTIVYDDAAADMSVTQAARVVVPARDEVIPRACEQKTVFLDDDMAMTRAVPAQILQSKDLRDDGMKPSRTIVYEDAAADMSVTQAVERVALPIDRKTIFDMAITRTLPSEDRQEERVSEPNATRRRTVVFGNDDGDISVTQAIPSSIINAESSEIKHPEPNSQGTMYFEDIADMSVTKAVPADLILEPRRKTIVFDDDDGHLSVTEAVPAGALLAAGRRDSVIPGLDNRPENTERGRTILYNNEDADISVTGVVMADIHEAPKEIEPENTGHRECIDGAETKKRSPVKQGSQIYSSVDRNISKTLVVPSNIINTESSEIIQPEPKQRTMFFENIANMSVTQSVPADLVQEPQRRKTIVFDDEDGNISMTEAVPAGALLAAGRRSSVMPEIGIKPENTECRKTTVYNKADMSGTQSVPAADLVQEPQRRKTIVFDDDDGNISMTEAVPAGALLAAGRRSSVMPELGNKPENTERRRTIVYNIADMSVTQSMPADLGQEPQRRKTIVFDDDDGNISMPEAVPASAPLAAGRRSSVMPELGIKPENTEYRRTSVYNNEAGNISITGVVTASIDIPSLTDPNKHSPEKEGSDILDNSMRPQVSPSMSRYTPDASFDAKSNSPKRDSLGGRPNDSERASILDALLDMSQASMEALAIEYIPEAPAQGTASNVTLTNTGPASNTTITIGAPTSAENEREDEAVKKDETKENVSNLPSSMEGIPESSSMEDIPERPALEGSLPLPIEYKKDKHGIVCKLQHKLTELKDFLHFKERASPKKSHSKPITYSRCTESGKNLILNTSIAPPDCSVELKDNVTQINNSDLKSASPEHAKMEHEKTLTVNLSSRTSTSNNKSSPEREKNGSLNFSHEECDQEPEQKEQSQWTGQADDTRAILDALSDFTNTRRSGDFAPQPSSPDKSRRSAPDRKSMVMSHENLLREISMAQAIMKTQQTEELAESSDEEATPPRHSNNVVKSLRFEDDESIVEPRVLHKPAAAKSPPRRASAVIPTYDVSDHVKELVNDLIKPMADVVPLPDFTRSGPSRSSQADTLDSSQIDLIPSSPVLIEPRRSCLRAPVAQHSEYRSPSPRRQGTSEAAVIVFDHLNPLNNILLPPPDQSIVHKYNPRRSQESVSPSLDSQAVQTEEEIERKVDCGMVLVTATVDRAVASERTVRDNEANTSIAMKGNRELLAASSSLTLVDDALGRSGLDVAAAARRPRSPVHVIFKLEEPCSSVKLESDLTSCDESECKGQKRGHIASKGPEVTPKPAIKVQKTRNSSKVRRLRTLSPSEQDMSLSEDVRSPASSVTMSTVSTVAAVWSCASSGAERVNWQPELMHEPSSKNLACEQDPGVNVVAKIDVLPFMGTSECEWESRAADTWSFRLLRARLRLVVRLEHRACNTTRAAVRADTPVRLVFVQHARDSDGDPVAALCLCLAAEALQRVAARGCARAGLVPGLLRRCAALARVALRWGRAMRAARAALAFTLADDGLLCLKVANIPLRSVWELQLRIELVDAGRGAPWPRAVAPRVTRVVAAWAPATRELHALLDALPEDWGHVPRAVWKLFKYLKNKRPEDDLLA